MTKLKLTLSKLSKEVLFLITMLDLKKQDLNEMSSYWRQRHLG